MERTGVSGKSYMARAPPSWGILSYKRIRTLKGSMYWIKKKKKDLLQWKIWKINEKVPNIKTFGDK